MRLGVGRKKGERNDENDRHHTGTVDIAGPVSGPEPDMRKKRHCDGFDKDRGPGKVRAACGQAIRRAWQEFSQQRAGIGENGCQKHGDLGLQLWEKQGHEDSHF